MSKKHILAGVIGERERQYFDSVVDEIFAEPGDSLAFELMPITDEPAAILLHEVVSGMGGKMQERQLGEKGKPINGDSSQVRYFDPGSYQEHALFTERDILRYRKFGTMGDRGIKGLNSKQLDELGRMGRKLELRMKNRFLDLIWNAIVNGTFVWEGVTFSFNVPSANTIAAGSTWTSHSTATPFTDLYLLQTTNAKLIKYHVKAWGVNPKTWADIMMSGETQKVIANNNITDLDPNKIAKFLYPGLAPIVKIEDKWQDESLASDGQIQLADAAFFFPNDKVLMIPDLSGTMYNKLGEFQISENMNGPEATLDTPAHGPYVFLDEKGLEQRESPYVKVVGGFNGGPNLKRRNDVFIITTT